MESEWKRYPPLCHPDRSGAQWRDLQFYEPLLEMFFDGRGICRSFPHSPTPDIGHHTHVFRPGAAAAADPLRPGAAPPLRQFAKILDLSIALPAPMHRIPLLAGVGINDDGFAGDFGQLSDKAGDQFGARTVDADADNLRLPIKQFRALPQSLPMGNMRSIPAREAEVRRHISIRAKRGQYRPGFLKRGDA